MSNVRCKVCNGLLLPGPAYAEMRCCGAKIYYCGCKPVYVPDIAEFFSKLAKLHAVVCKGKGLN